MNNQNLEIIFKNYIDNFDMMNDSKHNETYKWEAVQHFQNHWDIEAEDFGMMFKRAVKATDNLINNSVVQPTNGIVELSKHENDAVRELFRTLYADEHGDLVARQKQIEEFVSSANLLLEKYAPGKWKYAQDVRTAIFYLSLRYPDDNFMYKSTPASAFARCVEYENDIGGGQYFKLHHYHILCEWLVEELKKSPDLLEIHRKRFSRKVWPDEKLHILAYDIIYCAVNYNLYQNTVIRPRDKKSLAVHEKQIQTNKIQQTLFELQTQLDDVREQLTQLDHLSLCDMTVTHKHFGAGKVLAQDGAIITIRFMNGDKKLVLPDVFVNKSMATEDPECVEHYLLMDDLKKKERQLRIQMQVLEIELPK